MMEIKANLEIPITVEGPQRTEIELYMQKTPGACPTYHQLKYFSDEQ